MDLDKVIGFNTKRALKDKVPHMFFIFFLVVAAMSLCTVAMATASTLVNKGVIYSRFYISEIFGIISEFEVVVITGVISVYFFIIAPMFYGIINWSAKTAQGEHDDFNSFFCCFRDRNKYKNAIIFIFANAIISLAIYFLLINTTRLLFEISIENNILSPNSEMAAAAFLSAVAGIFFAILTILAVVLFAATSMIAAFISTDKQYNGIVTSTKRAIALLKKDGFMLIQNIFLFLLLWALTFLFLPFFIFAFYFSIKLGIAIKVSDKRVDIDSLFK